MGVPEKMIGKFALIFEMIYFLWGRLWAFHPDLIGLWNYISIVF